MSALRVHIMYILSSQFIICVLFAFVCDGKYSPLSVKIDRSLEIFTDEKIAKFDGSDPNKPIYMGIKGAVFDVSKGKDFYGKGASYNALVGKDSTRAVGKMSLDPSDLNSNISDLDDETLKFLDDIYTNTYLKKYPVIGYMQYLVEAETDSEEMLQDKDKHEL